MFLWDSIDVIFLMAKGYVLFDEKVISHKIHKVNCELIDPPSPDNAQIPPSAAGEECLLVLNN